MATRESENNHLLINSSMFSTYTSSTSVTVARKEHERSSLLSFKNQNMLKKGFTHHRERKRNTIQNTLFQKKNNLEVAVTSSSIKSPLYLKCISAINFFQKTFRSGLNLHVFGITLLLSETPEDNFPLQFYQTALSYLPTLH